MPTILTHVLVGSAIGLTTISKKKPVRFWMLSAFCAAWPDIDSLGFALGVKYGGLLGHRGLSHSLLFAAVLSALVVLLFFRKVEFRRQWPRLLVYFFLVTASHDVFDALTTGGLGVAFFAPFDSTRYFFPWRRIMAAPVQPAAFFGQWGWEALSSEFVWVWLPTAAIVGVVLASRSLVRRLRR